MRLEKALQSAKPFQRVYKAGKEDTWTVYRSDVDNNIYVDNHGFLNLNDLVSDAWYVKNYCYNIVTLLKEHPEARKIRRARWDDASHPDFKTNVSLIAFKRVSINNSESDFQINDLTADDWYMVE